MNAQRLSLLTDFYELTMMQGYFFNLPDAVGVFDMFFRQQPFDGGYTVFAGLTPLLEALEALEFHTSDIEYLSSLNTFHPSFLDYLSGFRFRGDVCSLPEGTVVFPGQPLIRVHGSLMETQLVESMLLNFINFQSLIATKTARIVESARGGPVMQWPSLRCRPI